MATPPLSPDGKPPGDDDPFAEVDAGIEAERAAEPSTPNAAASGGAAEAEATRPADVASTETPAAPPPAPKGVPAAPAFVDRRTVQSAVAFVFVLGIGLGALVAVMVARNAGPSRALLAGLNLGVTFPPGFREHTPNAADLHLAGFPEGTGFVYRGESSSDPDHGIFVGVRALGEPLPTTRP